MSSDAHGAGGSARLRAQQLRDKARKLESEADNWERGADGEAHTAARLAWLPPGFVALHDLRVPRHKANIDHVVIGPTGVWVIDTKTWAGRLTQGSGTLWQGRRPIRHETATVRWEAEQLAKHLDRPVRPVLAFVGTQLPQPYQQIDGVSVCTIDALITVVTSEAGLLRYDEIEHCVRRSASLLVTPATVPRVVAPEPIRSLPHPGRSSQWPHAKTQRRFPAPGASRPRKKSARRHRRTKDLVIAVVLIGIGVAILGSLEPSSDKTPPIRSTTVATPSTAARPSTAVRPSVVTPTTARQTPTTIDLSSAAPSMPVSAVTCIAGRGWLLTFTGPSDWVNTKGYRFSRRSSPNGIWLSAGTWYPTDSSPLEIGPVPAGKTIYLKVEARTKGGGVGPATEFDMQVPADACK
ncbi:MAG: NERD domain-containing protein [Acidimicrobiia bacterium]